METEHINMVESLAAWRKTKIKSYPCNSNRASQIGHPCERFHVLSWTSWDKVEPIDEGLKAIFDDGNLHETDVIIKLQQAGIEVFQQQIPLGEESIFRKLNITGHLDWKVREGGKAIPVEFKTMNSYTWDQIDTIDDMLNHEKVYIRGYIAQLSTYLLMTDSEYGYFLLKNKNTAQLKQIRLDLDYEYAEKQLKKIERVNEHLKNKTLPDCIEYDEGICGYCRHKVTCNPKVPENYSLYFMDKPEFAKMLQEREDSKAQSSIYNKVDKKIKETLKASGKLKITCGDFLMTCKVSKSGSQRWNIERL